MEYAKQKWCAAWSRPPEWSHVTESQNVDEMVDSYHKTITTTLDIQCPIKRRTVRTDNCFTMMSLIDKPKKARDWAYKNYKKLLARVYLSKLETFPVRKAKRQYASKKLTTAVSSHMWCRKIDKIDGKTQPELPKYYNINEHWLTTRDMTEELNKYLSNVGAETNLSFSRSMQNTTA